MDGGQDGEQAQGQQGDPQAEDEPLGWKASVPVGAPVEGGSRAALAEREAQIAEAAKTVESAEVLAK